MPDFPLDFDEQIPFATPSREPALPTPDEVARLRAEIDRLSAVAGAAGHGWQVAMAAANKAIAAHECDVDRLNNDLRRGGLERERQRIRHAETLDRVIELETIVRGLAAVRHCVDSDDPGTCPLCLAGTEDKPAAILTRHAETCPWRRAKEYVARTEEQPSGG